MFVYDDIEMSMLKHTSGFFISQFYSLCTLVFLPLECQLFLVKQINNLSNVMTQNTLFTLNWNCAASPLVCHYQVVTITNFVGKQMS